MRTTAEIEPVALIINLQVLIGGNRIDQLDLVGFALVGKHLTRLVTRPDFLGEGLVALDDLLHPLFDLRQIVRREGLVLGKVVIEAVFDHRADGDLRAGPQFLHGLGHHVGRVVADQLQGAGIFARDDLELAGNDRIGQVAQLAIQRDRDGLLCKRLGDRFGDFAARRASGIAADGTIGKCKGNSVRHVFFLVQSRQRMRVVLITGTAGKLTRG